MTPLECLLRNIPPIIRSVMDSPGDQSPIDLKILHVRKRME